MTTTKDEVELHECQCGCGTMVPGRYARGHWARKQAANRKLTPLPGPNDDLEPEEDLPADLVAELDELDNLDWIDSQPQNRVMLERDLEEPQPDPPAGRIPPPRSRQAGKPSAKRVTVAIERDVKAKIRMVLMPAGKVWELRDPLCGGTFVQQEPDISEALAEIVCDSPDLLNWFTGPAGGYMKYFKLLMAVQPVAVMLWMHHVAHADRVQPGAQEPQQMANYAA